MKVTRPTKAGESPISISRIAMNRNASLPTSAPATRESSARAFGPAMLRPMSPLRRLRRSTPSSGRCRWNQRRWYASAGPEPKIMKRSGPSFARVKSPIRAPRGLSMGVSTILPSAGRRLASSRPSHGPAPGPVISYLAKPEVSVMPTPSRTARHSSPTGPCALERRKVRVSTGSAPGGAYHSACSSPNAAPNTAPFAFRRSWIGVRRRGRPAGRSSLGKGTRKRVA